MGYACPVCEDPQADGEHLANHLAFTAMLRGDDHEQWLDDHVADWADMDPPELAPKVVDHASEREYPQVFEDTTGDGDAHDHDHAGRGSGNHDDALPGGVDAQVPDADGVPEDVLSQARDLTRERREAAADASDDVAESAADEEPPADGAPDDESEGDDTEE